MREPPEQGGSFILSLSSNAWDENRHPERSAEGAQSKGESSIRSHEKRRGVPNGAPLLFSSHRIARGLDLSP